MWMFLVNVDVVWTISVCLILNYRREGPAPPLDAADVALSQHCHGRDATDSDVQDGDDQHLHRGARHGPRQPRDQVLCQLNEDRQVIQLRES